MNIFTTFKDTEFGYMVYDLITGSLFVISFSSSKESWFVSEYKFAPPTIYIS